MNLPEYRPVVFLGYGYRASGRYEREGIPWEVPILTSWRGMDLVPDNFPYYFGRPGSISSKYANLIVQNATHLLVIGARLDYPTTGYMPERFGNNAKRVESLPNIDCREWIIQCGEWKQQYPLPETWVDKISLYAREGDILVPSSSGMASEMFAQCFKVKKNQRVIFAPGLGAMGFALPMAVGCAMAEPTRRVICIEGDGSLQVNVQALQTISQHNLNIKIFVLSNFGYASIRNTQKARCEGRMIGCDPNSGLTFPRTQHLAWTYGVDIEEINISPDTVIRPRLTSRMEGTKIIPGRLEDIE